jgi:hypothetical protein
MARTVAQWKVMRQREKSKSLLQGKKPTMTKERIQKLNNIGSAVCSIPVQVDDWIPRLKELENFQKENGHCRVPGLHIKDSETYPLACWVARQRPYKLLRQEKKGFIHMKERIQTLNAIGFEWSKSAQVDSWDKRFEELKAFQKEHGHWRVPGHNLKDSATYQLAGWVSMQRRQYKKSSMKEERIVALNDIGFEWSVPGVDWDGRFEELKAFQKEHGHCRVPGKTSKDSATHQLAWWVSNQRAQYKMLQQGKKSQMKEERIQKLNDIGVEWSVSVNWDERFEQLKAFQKEHGHFRVPGAQVKNSATQQLAKWVLIQRMRCKRLQQGEKASVITEGKIQRLNEIGFV